MNMNPTTEQHIILDMEGSIQEEILHTPAKTALHEGKMSDTDTFFQELCRRGQECTTGFRKGIVIPHARHTCIKEAGILFVRMKHKIKWKSIDEKPMEAAVCPLAPDDKHNSHLKTLLKLARRPMYEDSAGILRTAEGQQILSKIIDTVS